METEKYNYLAIIIIGQIRTFDDCYDGLKKVLDTFKKQFQKIVIFFYISGYSTYDWQYESIEKKIGMKINESKQIVSSFSCSEEKFKNKLIDLDCEYELIFKKELICHNIIKIQFFDFCFALNMISDYETKNNITFDYIFKTRCDIVYPHDFNIFDNMFISDKFYFTWDLIYAFSRKISKNIENNSISIYNDHELKLSDMQNNKLITPEQQTNICRFVHHIIPNYIKNTYKYEILQIVVPSGLNCEIKRMIEW
jgi:hypothetical protein